VMVNECPRRGRRRSRRMQGLPVVLFLLSIVAGGFGEFYVPDKLIVSSSDAAATAKKRHCA